MFTFLHAIIYIVLFITHVYWHEFWPEVIHLRHKNKTRLFLTIVEIENKPKYNQQLLHNYIFHAVSLFFDLFLLYFFFQYTQTLTNTKVDALCIYIKTYGPQSIGNNTTFIIVVKCVFWPFSPYNSWWYTHAV